MSSSHTHEFEDDPDSEDEAVMLDPNDAEEILEDDEDAAMDSGDDYEQGEDQIMEEIQIQNDSSAHFDKHKSSIFCIAQHPLHPNIVATGGGEGEEDDSPGIGYIFDATPEPTPVLPTSYQSAPDERVERSSQDTIFTLAGHTDSINVLTFTLPNGDFLLSGGLDGKLQAYAPKAGLKSWGKVGEVQEVEEINWLIPCPNPAYPNTVALGAENGSVWVYTVDTSSPEAPLQIVNSWFVHTETCTAGSWSSDGKLLATVSEDGSLYVWDVFGEASAAGLTQANGTVVGLTSLDQRFAVEGGLFSVAIAPNGAFVAVGGAGGAIKVIGLPRLGPDATGAASVGQGGPHATAKGKGGKQASAKGASAGQAGIILADLQAQSDGIESLAFAAPPLTLMAAGSVDGSIALFDSQYKWAVRRHIKEAHEDYSVVKVEFVKNAGTKNYLLTSCGMDGVVRRWDTRGGTAMPNSGLIGEWKGHRGEGEGGGVMGFVQGDGSRVVTAGDDGVSLVFETPLP
jgi:ribosome assembly protein SQT1